MNTIKECRRFLKDDIRKRTDFTTSDQSRGVPVPPEQLPLSADTPRITLPAVAGCPEKIKDTPLFTAIGHRRSRRKYSPEPLLLEELSFLLWATQGVRNPGREPSHFRTVPSAGARHSFETYLFVNNVQQIPRGLYRYLALSHELALIYETGEDIAGRLTNAVFGQRFVATGSVIFVWTTVPYRMEWRYLQAAHRVILLDAGHVCQNLYLACEAIGAGTCAVAAYDQQAMDTLLEVDGENQFTIYLAPVGKLQV